MTKPTKWHVRPAKNSDQPGHSPSRIGIFAVRGLGSWGPTFSSCGQRILWSDRADAQADLCLRWTDMPFCWLCHEVPQMYLMPYKTVMIQDLVEWLDTLVSINEWRRPLSATCICWLILAVMNRHFLMSSLKFNISVIYIITTFSSFWSPTLPTVLLVARSCLATTISDGYKMVHLLISLDLVACKFTFSS